MPRLALLLALSALILCACTTRPLVSVAPECPKPPIPAELRQTPPPPPPLTPGYADGSNAANGAAASPADLLTHAADYGAWCQGVAAQRDALLKLLTEEAR